MNNQYFERIVKYLQIFKEKQKMFLVFAYKVLKKREDIVGNILIAKSII